MTPARRPRLPALCVALLLAATACAGVRVRTQLEIDAPPEEVFAVLSDFAAYPEWNPYHVSVEGACELGARLVVRIERPDGETVTIEPHVLELEPPTTLTWGGGIRGVFFGEHVFRLEALEGGRTRLVHDEDFDGFAVGFADLPEDVLTEGYERMNRALAERVAALAGDPRDGGMSGPTRP